MKWGAMDIETNTAYEQDEDSYRPCAAWMYLGNLTMSDDEKPHFFTTWEEYKKIIDEIKPDIVFVHNLGYETEYMTRNGFRAEKIIANEAHSPISWTDAERKTEYRCSWKLTDQSVAQLGRTLDIDKMEYDYDGIRDAKNLTAQDFEYNARDTLIVIRTIKIEIEKVGGDIKKLPLTKTGKVRAKNKEADTGVIASAARRAFTSEEIYDMLERAFIGGLTVGNAEKFGAIIDEKVFSADKKSSYPAVMISKSFPMRFREPKTGKEADRIFRELQSDFDFVAELKIGKIKTKDHRLCVLSRAKICFGSGKNIVCFNGKISSAEDCVFTFDSQTWRTMQKVYDFENVSCVKIAVVSSMRPLPSPLIKTICELAEQKEEIGGRFKAGDSALAWDYKNIKEMLNSEYGANVQKLRSFSYEIKDDGTWVVSCDQYKMPKHIMRAFAWGVWITAYARDDLINAILSLGVDNFIYSDTDSIKSTKQMKTTSYMTPDERNYLRSVVSAKSYKSVKNFGNFEQEKPYDRFLQLGAKKYFYEQDKKFGFTVAGLPKSENAPKGFEEVKAGATYKDVKLASYFVDNDTENKKFYLENSVFSEYAGETPGGGGVALMPTDYTLNITQKDAEYCEQFFGHRFDYFDANYSKIKINERTIYQIWEHMKR